MADENKDLAGQLEIQNEINKVLKQRAAIFQNQNKYLSSQVQMAVELCKALECKDLAGVQERLEDIKKGLEGAAESAKRLESGAQSAGTSITNAATNGKKSSDSLGDSLNKTNITLAGIAVAAVSAFEGLAQSAQQAYETVKGLVNVVGNIASSLIAIPFDILDGLFARASANATAWLGFRQEVENVRESFGGLAGGAGKQVMGGLKSMKNQMSDTGAAGISFGKVFGYGPEGMARALQATSEMMKDLGSNMHLFGSEIAKDAGVLHVYRQGLGLTGDAFKAMADRAQTSGSTLKDTLNEVASQAIQMGKQFGLNGKEIASVMGELAADVGNFGNMTTKQLASMAVYTKKLGINAKELNGVVAKWDNFEDAAQGASQLSQAFGMNIDAMEMMKEQDPAKRMDMLRQSFQATGKSVNDLSRQELKLLSAQMGLSEEAAKKALSSDVDYDELAAASDEAAEKTLTEAEAMKELADAIKTIPQGGKFTSIGQALAAGFEDGLLQGEGVQKMLNNLNQVMMVAYNFAKELGRNFVNLFPGIQDIIKGITDLFDPARIKALADEFLKAFTDLFADLKDDPKAGFQKFFDRIKNAITNFFKGSGDASKGIKEGLIKFGKTALVAIVGLIPVAIKGLAELITGIVNWLKEPAASGSLGDGVDQAFSNAMEAAPAAILGALKELGSAFLDLVWELKGPLAIAGIVLAGLFATQFALSIIAGAAKAVISGIVVDKMKEILTKKLPSVASPPAGSEKATKANKTFAEGFGEMLTAFRQIEYKDILKAGIILAGIAVLMAGAMVLFAAALALSMNIAGDALKDPGKVFTFMGALAIAIGGAAITVWAASKLNAGDIGKAIPGLIAVALLIPFLGAVGIGIMWLLNKVETPPIDRVLTFMLALAGIMAISVGVVLAAAVIGTMSPAIVPALLGLAAMVLMAPALALVGIAIMEMIKAAPDLPIVKLLLFLTTLAAMFLAVAVMIPVAVVVGALMLASFGGFSKAIDAVLEIMIKLAVTVNLIIAKIAEIPFESITKLAVAMPAIGQLLDVLLKGIVAVIAVSVAIELLEGGEETVNSALNLVNNMMQSMGETLTLIIAKIDSMITGEPDKISKKISTIANLISALSPITDIVKAGLELAKVEPAVAVQAMNAAAATAATLASSLGGLVTDIVSMTQSLSLEDLKKAEAVGKLLAGVGTIISGIKIPPELLNTTTGTKESGMIFKDETPVALESSSSKMAAFGSAMTQVLGAIGPAIGSMVGAIQGIVIADPKQFSAKADAMSKVFQGIGALSQVITALGAETAMQVPAGQGGFDKLLTYFEGGKDSKIQKLLDGVGGLTIPAKLPGIATSLKALTESINSINSAVQAAAATPAAQAEASVKAVSDMVAKYQELEKLLSTTKPIDIGVKLKEFGKNMALSSEKIQIENKPINITVNLSITMDADEIAYGLSNTKRPTGQNTITLSRLNGKSTQAGAE